MRETLVLNLLCEMFLQVVDFVTYKALQEDGVGPPWTTRNSHPRSKMPVWARSPSGRMETVSASLPQGSSADRDAAKRPATTTVGTCAFLGRLGQRP
jgi:hypothetical protein